MASLLKIDVSPRGDHSVSRKLGNEFLEQFQQANPGSTVITRNLATTNMPFVDLPWIMGAYSPEEARTPEHKAALKLGDEFIAEIKAADHILLTTPMYNFAVPAVLKAWIDHICRIGQTFKVNADGSYAGLIEGKKATIIIASSGNYGPGSPAESYNAEKPYLKLVLGFLGIKDVTFVDAGGTYVLNSGQTPIEQFTAPFADQLKSAAAV